MTLLLQITYTINRRERKTEKERERERERERDVEGKDGSSKGKKINEHITKI